MTDWTTITDSQVDPKAPVTSELMTALRDNPAALAERATGAPYVESVWYPYNSDVVGGSDGIIYDFDVDGGVNTVESPDFEAGYDYRFIISGWRHNSSGSGLGNSLYRETSAAYASVYSSAALDTNDRVDADIYIKNPYVVSNVCLIHQVIDSNPYVDAVDTTFFEYQHVYSATAQRISKIRFDIGGAIRLTAGGKVTMLRRKVSTT